MESIKEDHHQRGSSIKLAEHSVQNRKCLRKYDQSHRRQTTGEDGEVKEARVRDT